jgi:hypothetical protein
LPLLVACSNAPAARLPARPPAGPVQWDWLDVAHCLLMEAAVAIPLFIAVFFWVGLTAVAGERRALAMRAMRGAWPVDLYCPGCC